MFTENLDIFLSDFAVDVIIDGSPDVTIKALFDRPDELAGGLALSSEYQITAKTSDVSGVAEGTQVTIAGVNYRTRYVAKVKEDGGFSVLELTKE